MSGQCWLLSVAIRTLVMVLPCFALPASAADIEWTRPNGDDKLRRYVALTATFGEEARAVPALFCCRQMEVGWPRG